MERKINTFFRQVNKNNLNKRQYNDSQDGVNYAAESAPADEEPNPMNSPTMIETPIENVSIIKSYDFIFKQNATPT